MNKEAIVRDSIYGIIAGAVSTIVIDIVALVTLSVMGFSLASFFALIGRCFLNLIGTTAADPVWYGVTLHYSIGILTGLLVGLISQRFHKLQFSSYRKGILLSIIVAEVEGNSLFYLMALMMNVSQSEIVFMYGLCCFFHLIWGACLGLIISYGQQHKATAGVHLNQSKALILS